jgi:hypothetical protein
MIGLGLKQLQDVLNRKADAIQREFIAASDRLRVIGLKLVESRGEDRERLLAEQEQLREKQRTVAEEVNHWRERARQLVLRGEGDALRAYLMELLELKDLSVRPTIERALRMMDSPETEIAQAESLALANYQANPALRLLERARTEYDLRGTDPAPRQRAAVDFATRPGMALDEEAIALIDAAIDDSDPIVREVATLTLVQLHRFRAMNLADLEAAHESVKRLAKIDHSSAIQPLIEVLSSPRSGYVQGQEDRNASSRMVALTRLIEWHTAAAHAAVQCAIPPLRPGSQHCPRRPASLGAVSGRLAWAAAAPADHGRRGRAGLGGWLDRLRM